jgi:DNA gyrase/topoisomerase IV subunit A
MYQAANLLQDDNAVYQLMVEEFQDMDNKFGHDRKTRILQKDGQLKEMDLITNARSGREKMKELLVTVVVVVRLCYFVGKLI